MLNLIFVENGVTVRGKKNTKAGKAGRPTSGELERRKSRVVEVATSLFIRDGYSATSLVDIAKQAGVATRTIYQHFGDKEKLFHDVIFTRENAPSVPVPRAMDSETLFDCLIRAGQYAVEVSLNQKTVDLMRLMVGEQNRFPDLTKRVANASFDRFRANIERIFSDLAHLGRIPDGDHLESARFFTDFVLGATPFYNYTHWLDAPPNARELDAKVKLFIAGRFGEKIAKLSQLPVKADRSRRLPKLPELNEASVAR